MLRLTINRPDKRNALSMALLDALREVLQQQSENEAIKCVVITGAGDRCFAAGGDLDELNAVRSADDTRAMAEMGRAALDQVRYFPVPVVGLLNGLALGGGAELAMACDLRVAATQAELGFIQAQLNVTTAWGGSVDLISVVGGSAAFKLLASGQRVAAEDAERAGLDDAVCAKGQALDECLAGFLEPYLARSVNVLRGYKAVAAEHRRALHSLLDELAQDQFVAAWTHEDHWSVVGQTRSR